MLGTPPQKNSFFLSTMKKIKIVQNCLKWQENWQNRFLDFLAPPPKKKIIWGAYKTNLSKMEKIKVVQNWLKWREHWSKTSLGLFSPPPQKIYLEGVQQFFVENEKNQSCSKLPEMARTLVENEFWTFQPPPPPQKKLLKQV